MAQPPAQPRIYHILHVDRLASVVAAGGLCGIVAGNVAAFRTDDHGDDQWQAIDGINRSNQNRTLAGLLTSMHRIQIDEIDVATLDTHRSESSPSISVRANSA